MSPPRTRPESSSESTAFDAAQRKRKNSDNDNETSSLIDRIDGLKMVCNNTFKVVNELKAVVGNLLAENIGIKAELCKLHELHSSTSAKSDQCHSNTVVQLKKLNSATTSSNAPSYSAVTKSNPVVVIKPKDATQASSATKKDLSVNISPSTTFCGIRDASNGGIVIECESIAGSNNLLKNATDKLGANYVVTIPSKRPTKIRVVGMSENMCSKSRVFW